MNRLVLFILLGLVASSIASSSLRGGATPIKLLNGSLPVNHGGFDIEEVKIPPKTLPDGPVPANHGGFEVEGVQLPTHIKFNISQLRNRLQENSSEVVDLSIHIEPHFHIGNDLEVEDAVIFDSKTNRTIFPQGNHVEDVKLSKKITTISIIPYPVDDPKQMEIEYLRPYLVPQIPNQTGKN